MMRLLLRCEHAQGIFVFDKHPENNTFLGFGKDEKICEAFDQVKFEQTLLSDVHEILEE